MNLIRLMRGFFDAVGYKVSTDFRLRLKSGFEKSFIEVKKMREKKKKREKLLVILVIYDAQFIYVSTYNVIAETLFLCTFIFLTSYKCCKEFLLSHSVSMTV